MANTENIEAKLCAYIDGDLDAAGRLEIEKHLAANPQHRGLIEQLSRQRDWLRELPRERAPEEILEALQSQMERSVLLGDADAAAEAETLKIHRWPQVMAAAAIVLLTIGLGAVIYFVLPRNGGVPDASYARVAQPGAAVSTAEADEADAAGAPSTVTSGGAALADSSAAASSESGDRVSRMFKSEAPRAVLLTPAPEETAVAKDDAAKGAAPDVFAPHRAAGRAASESESALAMSYLRTAQDQLQNADIARQLKESPGGLHDNAMFMVVATADPSAARSEVTQYLESNKIAWDSVTHLAPQLDVSPSQDVNLSRAQRTDVRMKGGVGQPAQTGEIGKSKGFEAKSGLGGVAQDKLASRAAEAPAQDQTAQPQHEENLQATQQREQTAQQQSPPSSTPATPTPATDARAGVADAGTQLPGESTVMSNVTTLDEGLLQATEGVAQSTTQPVSGQQLQQEQQPILQPALEKQLRIAPDPSTGRLIIARNMTRQQAAELSGNLAKQTTVQRAAVYEQRSFIPAATPERQSTLGVPTTGSSGDTTAPLVVAQELAPAALPATGPTTVPLDMSEQVSAGAPTTREAETPTTTTAPSPLPLGAENTALLAEAATRPGATSADERVDVVILVQDDVPPAVLTEDPAALQPNATPTPTPTTHPAPTTAPTLPTTQPGSERIF